MRSSSLLTKPGTAGCVSLLISWAAISCTLTTDLDFVGPAKETPEDTTPQTHAPSKDAGTHDASNPTSDDSSASDATETASSTSKSEGTPSASFEPDASVTMLPGDASTTDTTALDASVTDAGYDASSDSGDDDCVVATKLLAESYESDLTQWTAVNWQSTECQHTDVATDIAADKAHSVRSRIQCASDSDHLQFTSLQLSSATSDLTGREAPYGIVLSFSAWLSVGYDFDVNKWLDFLRFTGSCDRTDSPFSIGLNDPGRRLSISNRGSSDPPSVPVADAPAFPLAKWTVVGVYVNYTDGTIVVWQDGVLVTSATFQSGSARLCQLDFGTMASKAHTDLATFEDDVRLSVLEMPLLDTSGPPRICRE